MGIGHRKAVLGADEARNLLHGTGPVEGHHGGDVGKDGRLELPDVAAHARAFQLEDAAGLAA